MQNNKPRTGGANRANGSARARQGSRSGQRGSAVVRRRPGRRASIFKRIAMIISDMLSTRRGLITLCGGAAALVLIIVAIALLAGRGGGKDVVKEPVSAPVSIDEIDLTADETDEINTFEEAEPADAEADFNSGDDLIEETGESDAQTGAVETSDVATTVQATVSPISAENAYFSVTPTGDSWKTGKYAPEPQGEGYLPVFRSAGRDDKVIAITVDDCFQTENLKQIIQLADDVSGKLTIFPIGNLLKRQELQDVIKAAHANGHEIENHTWSHDGLYNLSDEDLAKRIFNQDRAVDLVLGINYHTHFLRPRGGDDRNDLRTHSYIRQLGYYGIAHWSVSGAIDIDKLKQSLAPGAVYLFHCTDADLTKLKEFIPYATTQGYQLVTFNDMFGYAANEEELLTDDPMTRTIIQLEPYTKDYKTIQATTYDYAAYEVQAALIEKGFLTGEPDGVYGPGTAKSAAAWQSTEGFTGDGVLTPEQQKKLLGVE